MHLINMHVMHSKFGEGSIVSVEGYVLTVDFGKNGLRRFQYPNAFKRVLTLTDDSKQMELLNEIQIEKDAQLKEKLSQMQENIINRQAIETKTFLYKGEIFRTHAEVLNTCFGCNYNHFQRAYKVFSDRKFSVWFPSIAKVEKGKNVATSTSNGWINVLTNNGTLITEVNESAINNKNRGTDFELIRFVFAKFGISGGYQFIGVFRPCYDPNDISTGYQYKLIGTKVNLSTLQYEL